MGLIPAAWVLNRRALRRLNGTREIKAAVAGEDAMGDTAVYENDDVSITLSLSSNSRIASSHVCAIESCPIAPPDGDQRRMKLFYPSIPAGAMAELTYEVLAYRRGAHEFPPLDLRSDAPFGFFRKQRQLPIPTWLLVYPEVRPLRHLELFDYRRAAEVDRPRAGTGMEMLGTRPYQTGDSPRYIHWRSSARSGRLISKEFADEAQPGLTIALDLYAHPFPQTESKHTPFEWMVKTAVSVAEYGRRAGHPIHIIADESVLPHPAGAVGWHSLLEYMARIQPDGELKLAGVLGEAGRYLQTFIAVFIPYPDLAVLPALLDLGRRAVMLAVVLDPSTFPDGGMDGQPFVGTSARQFADELRANGIDTKLISFGEDWTEQLI